MYNKKYGPECDTSMVEKSLTRTKDEENTQMPK